jgi:DNA-binding XRE family transcriptional regulator
MLYYGPYSAPEVRIGSKLVCEIVGPKTVSKFSQGKIRWPMGKRGRGRPGFIVFGDLAKAIRLESTQAVAHHWGVTNNKVSLWRRGLKVPINNPGTRKRWKSLARERPSNWTPSMDAMLGTEDDAKIGRRLNLSRHCIADRRQKLGIPGFFIRVDGKKVRQARLKAGLTQYELVENASTNELYVGRIERGEVATTRRDIAQRIADALGCELEALR